STYREYTALFDDKRPERLVLMSELRSAISTGQLVLYYQPKLHLENGSVAGFEALVRWNHPERGLISPAEFVPLIEISDLINPFTQWVVEDVVHQCRRWLDQGFELCLSANISAHNLLDMDLPP